MLHYIEANANNKVSVLFLHGLGAEASSWRYQLNGLSTQGYRLIAPDLPGFGNSPAANRPWRIDAASNSVVDLLDQLEIERTFVVGISLGGVVSLDMAIRHERRVQGLVLINSFASLKPGSFSEWRYFFRRGFRVLLRNPAAQAEIVAGRVFPGDEREPYRRLLIESIRRADPRAYRQAMLELARVDLTSGLSKIQAPVLVISGAEDTTIPLKNQKLLAASITGAEHIIIPQAGHGVIVDQPEILNRCLTGFIEEVRAGISSIPGEN